MLEVPNHHHLTWQWKNHPKKWTFQTTAFDHRQSYTSILFDVSVLKLAWTKTMCYSMFILGYANPSKEQLLNGSVQTYNHSPTHKEPFLESLKSLLSPTNHICNEVGDSVIVCPNWLNNNSEPQPFRENHTFTEAICE